MSTRVKNVIAFGDSIAAGAGIPSRRGWLQMLKERFYALNPEASTYSNAWFLDIAIPGETAKSLADAVCMPDSLTAEQVRRVSELERRHRVYRQTLTVVSFGGHQAALDLKERGEIDLNTFAYHVGRLASQLYVHGDVLYVGIPAPNVGKMMAYSNALRGHSALELEATILQYEREAIGALYEARSAGSVRRFEAVPLFEASLEDMYAAGPTYSVARDGIHPSEIGHAYISDRVQPLFTDMVGVEKSIT